MIAWLVSLGMLPAVSCSKTRDATQILAVVYTNLTPGVQLTRVKVQITDPDVRFTKIVPESAVRSDREWIVRGPSDDHATRTLPFSFAIAPPNEERLRDFRIVVTGYGPVSEDGAETSIIQQMAKVGYRKHEKLLLEIFLWDSCLDRLCEREREAGQDSACMVATGRCAEVPTLRLPQAGEQPIRDGARPQGDGDAAAAGRGGAGGASGEPSAGSIGATGGMSGTAPTQPPAECLNLQCQQVSCPSGATTSISGTIYDPAGNNPLYNVVAYVPNEPVQAFDSGVACNACESLYTGRPIAVALTDSTGRFTLTNAPAGSDIPLVVQVGKWRRQITVPRVTECQDNPLPDGSLRLPRNRMEGDIPNIAIATGGADTLECLLRRVGVDASEYTPGPGGEGRVHIFRGNPQAGDDGGGLFGGSGGDRGAAPNTSPPAPSASESLWNSLENLMGYDIVLLSCEGAETIGMNQQALHDYADMGGRVFASHFHYSWFTSGPYASENLAVWSAGANDLGDIDGRIVTTLANGMPFPKGQALFEWLTSVGALNNDMLPIAEAGHNADVNAMHTPSQPWIVADASAAAPGSTQHFSFNTPIMPNIGTDDVPYCGRVVFSNLHAGAAAGDDPSQPVPIGCGSGELSPEEEALEFMLFDLSACPTRDDRPPQPPAVE